MIRTSKKLDGTTDQHDRQLSKLIKSLNFSKTPVLSIPPAEAGMQRKEMTHVAEIRESKNKPRAQLSYQGA